MSLVHAWRPQTTQTTRAVPLIQHPPSTPRRAEGSSVGVCRRRVVWCACASPDARCMCLPASTSGARADQWPLRFSRLYPRPPHRPQRRPTLTVLSPGSRVRLKPVRSFVRSLLPPSHLRHPLSLFLSLHIISSSRSRAHSPPICALILSPISCQTVRSSVIP